jgi:D-3-phosphoglycerate dehydrogenase
MHSIQTLNKISTKGLDRLPRDLYETATELTNPTGILVRSAKMHDMALPESLLAIARAGAGTNNIPIDKCTDKGIVVFNTPGANANGVKEIVIAALLLSSRKIYQGINWAQGLKGKGDEVPALVEGGKKQFVGPEIQGKTLGVIGLGAIGVLAANAGAALGMKVLGHDPFISVEAAWRLDQSIEKATDLDTLLTQADYITLHLPMLPETKGLINKDRLARMKDGVKILNFSRGGLVNNDDLLAAIDDGKVGTYVTDFPEEELLGNDAIIPIPHLGASTPESEENCAIMACDQLREYLERGNIKNSVNFPASELPPSGKTRLLIANKNVPNMVGQITTTLAKAQINIDDLLNKHRGELAYNIIDVDDDIPQAVQDELAKISGIISVRVIPACK